MFRFLSIAAAATILAAVLASGASAQNNIVNTLQRTNTQNTGATRSTNTTTTTSTAARGGFDTATKGPPPVQANVAPKPSPLGQPVRSTATTQGYKPAAPPLRTNPVPPPQLSQANTVRPTTTTNTVVRSTTTATVPAKKP
jgi:hypothetical protein